MNIIEQSHEIIWPRFIEAAQIYEFIEYSGRVAYKSEAKIAVGSAEKFIRHLINLGHLSVLEHFYFTVKFVTDRGVTHEEVRHRLCNYTQESTRYCNYSKLGMTYIKPVDFELDADDLELLRLIENHYDKRISEGLKPQQARYFLPNGLKTEIVHTANVREWRHILDLRTSPAAHPQIRDLMKGLLEDVNKWIPVLFEGVG